MKVVILDCAEQDLAEGKSFYESQERGVGDYFLDSLSADIESLAWYAGIHHKVGRYYRSLAHTFPYAIYYTIDGEVVLVWAVLDSRRAPAWTRKQLRSRI
jgi:plasmid stabilization system protein ParE